MMKIAILGATSQIARDLIVSFSGVANKYLHLFARRPDEVTKWLASVGLSGRYPVDEFSGFAKQELMCNKRSALHRIRETCGATPYAG